MTTTVLETKIEGGLCRCCLTEGTYRNLSALYTWSGEREVYSEMLQESLDIHIKPVEGQFSELTWSICEACVLRLRDASSFKRQVLACELRFRELYQEHIVKGLLPLATVKIEVPEEQVEPKEEGDLHIAGDDFHDKYSDSDAEEKKNFNIEVQLEPLPLKKSRSAKAKTKSKGTEKKQSKAKKKKTKENAPESSEPTEDGPEPAKKGRKRMARDARIAEGFSVVNRDSCDKYLCRTCGKQFDVKKNVEEHIKKVHLRITKFRCPLCPERFLYSYSKQKHLVKIHGLPQKTFSCGACSQVFKSKANLRDHYRNFHMQEKNYPCSMCELKFFSMMYLKRHMIRHTGERVFECLVCRKTFQRKNTLILHERIHSDDRRFTCGSCDRSFVQKASLNYHMKRHHPELL